MLREYISVTLGVLTLLIASGAVYGILTLNTEIQAKPEQSKIPDYSGELNSLKSEIDSVNSQVSSIKNDLTTLDTLKNSMTDIRTKLIDLENSNNQVQQVAAISVQLTIILEKSTYFPSDTIKITAIGANPQNVVQIQLLDNDGFILIHKETWSDSTGKVTYSLQLSSALLPGNYQIKMISDQKTASQQITIVASSTGGSSSTGPYVFTVQTDKLTYHTGDLIEVSGTGSPNTSVTGVLTSHSGRTYNSVTTIQSDGSYVMFYATSKNDETGTWHVTVTNLVNTKVVYITVE